MKKILPHEISTEELLASLGSDISLDKEIKPSFNDPILSFLQAFNIKPGTKLVSGALLHRIFKLWFTESRIDRRNFNRQMAVYIPSRLVSTKRFYSVQENVLQLAAKFEEIESTRTIDKTKSKKWQKNFETFLEENNLKSGNTYIEGDILYYIYNRWLDQSRKKPLFSYHVFGNMCRLHFDLKRLSDSKINWYGVNSNIKGLITKEEVERWRKGRNTYGKHKKNKENEKDWAKPTNNAALYYKKNKKKSK